MVDNVYLGSLYLRCLYPHVLWQIFGQKQLNIRRPCAVVWRQLGGFFHLLTSVHSREGDFGPLRSELATCPLPCGSSVPCATPSGKNAGL